MMVTLEYVFVRFEGSPPSSKHCTNKISINTNSVVSVKPCGTRFSTIKEVNSKPVKPSDLTEVVYTAGDKAVTLTVVGRFDEISGMLSNKRQILHG